MLGMVSSIGKSSPHSLQVRVPSTISSSFWTETCQVEVAPAHGTDEYFHQIETHGLVLSLLVSAYGIITSLVMKRWFNSEI